MTISPKAKIVIAMKVRHGSELVFFDLMKEANFLTENKTSLPAPGDEELGEEMVDVYVFSRP
jgi:hypothetical protein